MSVKCKYCCNYKNQWCEEKLDSPDPDLERECFYYSQATNGDRIRAMTDEELAWELMTWRIETAFRLQGVESKYPYTQKTILEWLKQPAEEEKNESI